MDSADSQWILPLCVYIRVRRMRGLGQWPQGPELCFSRSYLWRMLYLVLCQNMPCQFLPGGNICEQGVKEPGAASLFTSAWRVENSRRRNLADKTWRWWHHWLARFTCSATCCRHTPSETTRSSSCNLPHKSRAFSAAPSRHHLTA